MISLRRFAAVPVLAALLSGCATSALYPARTDFYYGRLQSANDRLDEMAVPETDRVLFLMDRGMIRQNAGRYEDSARDFLAASDELERLQTYSVSQGAASLVVNDMVQDFRGTPYERTLLHAFDAKNYLAMGQWDDAAVEARRIIKSLDPEVRDDYPDDAYARYMAGFCLEMIDDHSNAALEYRNATALLEEVTVDENTGHLVPRPEPPPPPATNDTESAEAEPVPVAEPVVADPPAAPEEPWPYELVCFVLIGRSPRGSAVWTETWDPGEPMYAEIHCRGQYLGRSYNLADTESLACLTEQQTAARQIAKTAVRLGIKEGLSRFVEYNTGDSGWGDITRLLLIGLLERPDVRRWETLPRWLQVARVSCPSDINQFEAVFKTASGRTTRTITVQRPINKRRNLFVSFVRDLPLE